LDGVLGRRGHNLCVGKKYDIWAEIVIAIIGIWLLIAGKATWWVFWVREA
jgi:hypothetical protein